MADIMTFPETVEEFMEQYKITDTEQIYTNGTKLVPIFRMRQWFEHLPSVEPEVRTYVSLADCVSKQAAIHAAIEAVDEWDGGYNLARADKIISAIKKLPSAEPEWIHVSERLPDKRATVIVSCIDNSGDTPFSYTACGYWVGVLPYDDPAWIIDGEVNYHVVAWMPLPEPWKGEQE